MTDLEKHIYNQYLTTTRQHQNKPFKRRENFDNFENDPKYLSIKRIATFVSKHKEVDVKMYFDAPYKIYTDAVFFDLNYYASPRAVKSYSLYKKQLDAQLPDNCIEQVKRSLIFLTEYCIAERIQLIDYIKYSKSGVPVWVEHIKTNLVHPYSLMELNGLYKSINTFSSEEQAVVIGPVAVSYFKYRDNYNNSTVLRPFLQQATLRIQNLIFKRLQN